MSTSLSDLLDSFQTDPSLPYPAEAQAAAHIAAEDPGAFFEERIAREGSRFGGRLWRLRWLCHVGGPLGS